MAGRKLKIGGYFNMYNNNTDYHNEQKPGIMTPYTLEDQQKKESKAEQTCQYCGGNFWSEKCEQSYFDSHKCKKDIHERICKGKCQYYECSPGKKIYEEHSRHGN